jgi:hypothetical protein
MRAWSPGTRNAVHVAEGRCLGQHDVHPMATLAANPAAGSIEDFISALEQEGEQTEGLDVDDALDRGV